MKNKIDDALLRHTRPDLNDAWKHLRNGNVSVDAKDNPMASGKGTEYSIFIKSDFGWSYNRGIIWEEYCE